MLKRINDALPGLVAGIVLYGIVVQLAGVWFFENKWFYSIGLWYGIGIAVGMAIHIAIVLHDTVNLYDEGSANKRVAIKAALRYAVVVVLFLLIGYFKFGSLLMAVIGVFGLKLSAYLQPLFNKLFHKTTEADDAGSCEENPAENLTGSDNEKNKEEVTM